MIMSMTAVQLSWVLMAAQFHILLPVKSDPDVPIPNQGRGRHTRCCMLPIWNPSSQVRYNHYIPDRFETRAIPLSNLPIQQPAWHSIQEEHEPWSAPPITQESESDILGDADSGPMSMVGLGLVYNNVGNWVHRNFVCGVRFFFLLSFSLILSAGYLLQNNKKCYRNETPGVRYN